MCNQTVISIISNEVVNAAKKVLGNKLDKVILYGSHARGDYDIDSDIDIMILADIPIEERELERRKIRRLLKNIDMEHDVVLSICVNDCATFYKYINDLPYFMNVINDGVILTAK